MLRSETLPGIAQLIRSTKLVFKNIPPGCTGCCRGLAEHKPGVHNAKNPKEVFKLTLSLNETDLHVVLCYNSQKVDIVVRVEPCHVLAADGFRPKHLHLPVQAVVHHQIVGHANPVWLHGVPLTVVIIPDLGCQRTKYGGTT